MQKTFIGLKPLYIRKTRQNPKISGMHTFGTKSEQLCILAHTNFRLNRVKNTPVIQIYLKCAFWLAVGDKNQTT